MRDIKFRGISVKTGNMIYGCAVSLNIFSAPPEEETAWIFVIRPMFDPQENTGWIKVKANTVGQYTGLKDKNGVEIYEGDILLHYDLIGRPEKISFNDKRPMTFVVEWDSEKARWAERHVHQYNNYILTDGSFLYAEYKVNNANEIIGNIYENPELLTHPAEGRN